MAIRRGTAGQTVSGKGVSNGKSKRATKRNKTSTNGKGCKVATAKKPAAKDTANKCDGNILKKPEAVDLKKPQGQRTTNKRSGRDGGKAVVFKKPAAQDTDKKSLVLMEDGFRNFKFIPM